MWNANDPNTQLVETFSCARDKRRKATIRVPLETIEFDEGHPVSSRHCVIEDFDRFAGWALITVAADEVEGL